MHSLLSFALVSICFAFNVLCEPASSNEALHKRSIYYYGGQYVYNATLGGTILTNDEYVEVLTPAQGVKQKFPIVLVHGGGPSGAVWSISSNVQMGNSLIFNSRYG